MTDEQFHNLPFLISRAQFLDATGLSDKFLTQAVDAGEIRQFRLTETGRKHKYYKWQAAMFRYPHDLPRVWEHQTRWLCAHGSGNVLASHLQGLERCGNLMRRALTMVHNYNQKEIKCTN